MYAKQRQSGFALLLFMIVMIGFITAGFSGLLSSRVKQKNEQARAKTTHALLQAKEALLSYAVNYSITGKFNDMGKLPCPDISSVGDEGNQDPLCGGLSKNTIGYLPYKTLGLGKLEDGNGECLWYVVSGDYKYRFNLPSPPPPPYTYYGMLNSDSVGYLNVVDENGNLKHGANKDEFPIALIISPGAALAGQHRSANAALPGCKANYNVNNYLEGGVHIDYSTDLPATADTLWKFLDTSESAHLQNADHNDQVIAIYRHELWDRIEKLKDLSFDNSAGVTAPLSKIESLTKSLAECIAAYGNADANANSNNYLRLPYPAPLALSDYRVTTNYNDNNPHHPGTSDLYGRFPQQIDFVVTPAPPGSTAVPVTSNFVMGTPTAPSYCKAAGVTPYDELFWKNWKDHFFYWVSQDFEALSSVPADSNKCTVNGCIKVVGKSEKVAAMIVYAGHAQATQPRIWWNDSSSGSIDDKSDVTHYLEGDNKSIYSGGNKNYHLLPNLTPNDYAYCVKYENSAPHLSAVKCADL